MLKIDYTNRDIVKDLADGYNFTKRLDSDHEDSLIVLRVVCRNSIGLIHKIEHDPDTEQLPGEAIASCLPVLQHVLEQANAYKSGQDVSSGMIAEPQTEVVAGLGCFFMLAKDHL